MWEPERIKMIIDKNNEGAWRISDIVAGYWVTKVYYFYTKKEAIKMFRMFRKDKNGKKRT